MGGGMEGQEREALEQEIRRHFAAGAFEAAAVTALRGYGSEILAFLAAVHKDDEDASEVFSIFCEEMWRALPTFGWQCSFRTWAYAICRHRSHTYRRDAKRRGARGALVSDSEELRGVEQRLRSETLPYLRTQMKSRFAELRSALRVEDQELLILRVDRQLAWSELVLVMHDGEPLAGEALKREAARLRKRFQVIKETLREAARREGLLDQDRSP
jgi:RNA polymerase sigma-70 factor (ECF subfamily)